MLGKKLKKKNENLVGVDLCETENKSGKIYGIIFFKFLSHVRGKMISLFIFIYGRKLTPATIFRVITKIQQN